MFYLLSTGCNAEKKIDLEVSLARQSNGCRSSFLNSIVKCHYELHSRNLRNSAQRVHKLQVFEVNARRKKEEMLLFEQLFCLLVLKVSTLSFFNIQLYSTIIFHANIP